MSGKVETQGHDGHAKSPAERMKLLERRATVVRSRLLRAVDALDARRHQVENIGEHAKEIAIPAVLGVAGVAVLFGASAAAFKLAVGAHRRRSLGYRVSEAIRGLDLVKRPSFTRRMIEKVALSLVTLAATELARRAASNLLDGRLADGRLAVGKALEQNHRQLSESSEGVGV